MKRLVEIADLPEVTVCFKQQKGLKAEVKALSDHNKSLVHFKTLVKELKIKTINYCGEIQDAFVFKKNKATKRSVIDYYTIMIENLMESFVEQAKKVVKTLDTAYNQAKQFHKKAEKIVIDSKKMIDQNIIYHQKLFKDYMMTVYPQTSSIFFRLKSSDKTFTKKQDPLKQSTLLQQYKSYQQILNNQIDKMNQTIRQMTDTFKQKTQNFKTSVVSWFQTCLPQFQAQLPQDQMATFTVKIQKHQGQRQRQRSRHKDDLDYY